MLELNEVLIAGEQRTLSLMARERQLTCLTGGTAERRTRWLHAMLGLEPVLVGYVCIDGEPLTAATADELRSMMSYAPARLRDEGYTRCYEAPTVQDVFSLRANRQLPISNGILAEEMRRTGAEGEAGRWIAVAALLGRPIVLADSPAPATADYLLRLARAGRTVIAATADADLLCRADATVTISED